MNAAELPAQSALSALPSAGEQLAAARESRGLSIVEIAQQLKLSPWQVEALESGDHKRLPSPVFVRGFIRNYARLVKLDAAELLATAEPQLPQAAPLAGAVVTPSAEIPFPTARRVNWYKYAIAAAILLVPLAIYEFYPDDTPAEAVKSGQIELPAPQGQVVAETSPAPVAAVVAVPAAVAPVINEAKPERVQKRAAPSTPDTAADVRRASGEQVVRLRFARESWVEIRDRNGRKIFSQLNAPGTEQVVSGLPPLTLIVGNANGVQLTHNEQPVNLGPYTKVDVARLTLE